MANIRSIKRRIKTAKNIAQTTRAMQLVAASRMKKAQIAALESKPYAERLLSVTRGLLGRIKDEEENNHLNYFSQKEKKGVEVILIVLSDKGLAGALVTNFARFLLKFIASQNKKVTDYQYLVFGKKGRDLVLRLGGEIIAYFDMGMIQPKFDAVPPVVKIITQGYQEEKFSRVYLSYTDFHNTLNQNPKIIQVLPLSKIDKEDLPGEYLFEPNSQEVLTALLPHYFEAEVYHALLESYASEQSARMTAMKNATENAGDIISQLTMYYNRARQQMITSEIADIITATLVVS